jgi:hypothetical protein
MIQPCIVVSLPLTEACLRFSRTSLFMQSFTQQETVRLSVPVVAMEIAPYTGENYPR